MATKRSNKAIDGAVKVSKPEPRRARGTLVSPERIAARAFDLYLARGGEPGRELEDWLRAEVEHTGLASSHSPEVMRCVFPVPTSTTRIELRASLPKCAPPRVKLGLPDTYAILVPSREKRSEWRSTPSATPASLAGDG